MMDEKPEFGASRQPTSSGANRSSLSRRSFLAVGGIATATLSLPYASLAQAVHHAGVSQTRFRRIPTQFIAALGNPNAHSGDNAHLWGLWRKDPGPRGVQLDRFDQLRAAHGVAPAQWKFDSNDWWLEEHGLIMEQPEFPLSPGKYLVTGNRRVSTTLTVYPRETDATQRWKLDDDATLYDVTHLACRSARYSPAAGDASCSPAKAKMTAFPVSPGASMPSVESCDKQDYAVLIVIGLGQ